MQDDELTIKFLTDEEYDLFTLVRVKARGEGISPEEFVINILKQHFEAIAPPPPPEDPTLTTGQLNEFRRRIGNLDMSQRREIVKLKKQIAVLAEAIASIQSQLDTKS